jgi:hypothetical protein
VNFYVPDFLTPGSGPIVTEGPWKQIQCSTCGLRPRGRVGSIAVRFGRKGELLHWVATAGGTLVRQVVTEDLTAARLAGWRAGVVRVDAVARLREQDLAYHEFLIIGHTREYAQAVGLVLEQECVECGYRKYVYPEVPLVMPESCWDRSDVFTIDELGVRVVTEAFREAVEKHGHTGIEFTPLSEWRRWWMPQN